MMRTKFDFPGSYGRIFCFLAFIFYVSQSLIVFVHGFDLRDISNGYGPESEDTENGLVGTAEKRAGMLRILQIDPGISLEFTHYRKVCVNP